MRRQGDCCKKDWDIEIYLCCPDAIFLLKEITFITIKHPQLKKNPHKLTLCCSGISPGQSEWAGVEQLVLKQQCQKTVQKGTHSIWRKIPERNHCQRMGIDGLGPLPKNVYREGHKCILVVAAEAIYLVTWSSAIEMNQRECCRSSIHELCWCKTVREKCNHYQWIIYVWLHVNVLTLVEYVSFIPTINTFKNKKCWLFDYYILQSIQNQTKQFFIIQLARNAEFIEFRVSGFKGGVIGQS